MYKNQLENKLYNGRAFVQYFSIKLKYKTFFLCKLLNFWIVAG